MVESNLGNIVDINDFGNRRKERIEEWLRKQIVERYDSESDVVVKNPLLRLSTIFECLSNTAQYELYGYAKKAALGECGRLSMKKEFWNFLELAPEAWDDIQEFADKLLIREKATDEQQERC